MKSADNITEKRTQPDLTLILSRVEKEILEGKSLETCRRILCRERVWQKADINVQLRCARLAQMADEVDTALKILCHINSMHPEVEEAWTERAEVLSLLDRREELVQMLALSRAHVAEEHYSRLLEISSATRHMSSDPKTDVAAAPFKDLRHRQQQIARYMELFSGREDCFARQWADKQEGKQGYVPVRRPMEPQDVEEHLSGRKTFGIYLLQSDGRVKAAVLDVDLAQKYRRNKVSVEEKQLIRRERNYFLTRVKELSAEIGLKPLIEFSGGKGLHFWYFFNPPAETSLARGILNQIKQAVGGDLTAFDIEVFPKQDSLSGKGLGNLVKLPLGVHWLTGKPSFFVECKHRSVTAQLDFLLGMRPANPDELSISPKAEQSAGILMHPRWRRWAETYPDLFQLERCCPPLAQIVACCRGEKAIALREEKVLFQTVGFLPRAKTLLHVLLKGLSDYNPHLVDYKLSRLRGSPLGCRRIHSLLGYTGEFCRFEADIDYAHPLLHLPRWKKQRAERAEKVEHLSDALDDLKRAVSDVLRFLK